MSRSLICSLGGAAVGFMIACVGVSIASGGETARDTAAITLLVGSLLAAGGAVAGAVIGGVADLRESVKRKRDASARDDLK